jgi:hypothetical protein
MSQKGTLLPEPIPVFFTTLWVDSHICQWAITGPELTPGCPSPDIMPRIEAILRSSALGLGGREGLDINQVLVNEYSPGQGISVSSCLGNHPIQVKYQKDRNANPYVAT